MEKIKMGLNLESRKAMTQEERQQKLAELAEWLAKAQVAIHNVMVLSEDFSEDKSLSAFITHFKTIAWMLHIDEEEFMLKISEWVKTGVLMSQFEDEEEQAKDFPFSLN